MTQKDKVKLERKNKIKSLFLKTLHIICYILSIAFIGICVFSGVQSCQKSNKVTAESYSPVHNLYNFQNQNINDFLNDYNFYYFDLYNPTLTSSFQNEILEYFDLPTENVSTAIGTTHNEYFDLPNSYVINVETNDVEQTSVFAYQFQVLAAHGDNVIRFWRLKNVFFATNDSYQAVLVKNDDDADDRYYLTRRYAFLLSNDDISNIPFFYSFFKLADKNDFTDFTFNQQFNYNAPMGVAPNSPYGFKPTGTQGGDVMPYLEYDVGWFLSNGQLFNKIRWRAQATLGAVTFKWSDGSIAKGPQGNEQVGYVWFEYVNDYSNNVVVVNQRNQVAYQPSSSSYGYYYDIGSSWIADQYRYIKFLTPLNDSLKDNINKFNNNNLNFSSGSITGGSDIFSLLSMAFNSLIPFLSVNILPSISIGVLLFLPTIVGIIVIIFNLLRK